MFLLGVTQTERVCCSRGNQGRDLLWCDKSFISQDLIFCFCVLEWPSVNLVFWCMTSSPVAVLSAVCLFSVKKWSKMGSLIYIQLHISGFFFLKTFVNWSIYSHLRADFPDIHLKSGHYRETYPEERLLQNQTLHKEKCEPFMSTFNKWWMLLNIFTISSDSYFMLQSICVLRFDVYLF